MAVLRFATSLAVALIALADFSAAHAQSYPTRPVRVVLGFAPGGVADIVTRTVAPKLAEKLGQQVIVDNRPSAGGILAAEAVARAEPDGYTLLLISGGNAVSSSLYKSLSYDPINDFAMVSTLGFFDLVIVTNAGAPYKTLKEFIDAAKAQPNALNLGTIAPGSTQHLAGELFRSLAAAPLTPVQYRQTPQLLLSLKNNEVHAGVEFIAATAAQIKDGEMRALGIGGAKRSAVLPDVPTIAEAGVPGYHADSWNGIAAPAKTPLPIVDRLNRDIAAALADPEVKSKLLAVAVEARGSTPEWLRDHMRTESQKWGRVIEAAGIEKQ